MELGPVDALCADGGERPVRVLDPGCADHVRELREADVIGLDIETDNFHSYSEKTCLLQLATPASDWFFDPLVRGMPEALGAELAREDRPLVMHAAENDVRALRRDFGLRLGRIFDTAVAARVLGLPTLGLKALLEAELDVVVDKAEQRSDWSQRPLTAAQLGYARDDVRWLTQLSEILGVRLDDMGRRAWHDEECDRLRDLEPAPKRFDAEGWRKVKSSRRLGPRGRSVMAMLWTWREERAAADDLPPVRVAHPEQLAKVARLADARGEGALDALEGLRGGPARVDSGELREVVGRGLRCPDPGVQAPRRSEARPGARGAPSEASDRERRARLRERRDERARALGVDPGFLLANQVVDRILREVPRNEDALAAVPGVGRWRAQVLGQEILDVFCS
jgi:ribonuclease D